MALEESKSHVLWNRGRDHGPKKACDGGGRAISLQLLLGRASSTVNENVQVEEVRPWIVLESNHQTPNSSQLTGRIEFRMRRRIVYLVDDFQHESHLAALGQLSQCRSGPQDLYPAPSSLCSHLLTVPKSNIPKPKVWEVCIFKGQRISSICLDLVKHKYVRIPGPEHRARRRQR